MTRVTRFVQALLTVALVLAAARARALPGFFAGQGKVPESDTTHVVVMIKGGSRVVTVMPDYKGDLKPFAFVMPVPSDVTLDHVKVLKRDYVDRVDQLTAPRFHEFWEMDPCEPGDAEQIWEIDRTAKSGTAFLSSGMMGADKATRKIAKELQLTVEPDFKKGEHSISLLEGAQAEALGSFLEDKGYKAPDGAVAAAEKYVASGMKLLVSEVDTKQIELVGGRRALLSPIRYATDQKVELPTTLGLSNLDGKQELYLYVLEPEHRYEVKDYGNVFPPTNLSVDFKVKERMGEFYAGLFDLLQKKHPKSFVVEYAWPVAGCGEPCPNEPLMIHELLTLGGDYFEESVPEEEKNPEPPEMTEEEKKKYEAFDEKDEKQKEEKERFEKDREQVARVKALLARQRYVLTRLHYRYDKTNLPKDVEIGPAPNVEGGVDLPEGPKGTLPTDVKTTKKPSHLQTRYVFFHPNKAVLKCEAPKRWRWGKPPRTYRGLRKIWVAQDMATKDRTSIKPAKMVKTPVPELGLVGEVVERDGGPDAGAKGEGASKEKCDCRVAGAPSPVGPGALLFGLSALGLALRRRR